MFNPIAPGGDECRFCWIAGTSLSFLEDLPSAADVALSGVNFALTLRNRISVPINAKASRVY